MSLENGHQVISYALENITKEKSELFPSLQANSITVLPGQIDLHHSDEFGQPLDKRPTNTWVEKIEDVSLLDCYTTQVINSIVPFHLISQLKDKLTGSTPSWVINVSSMEGVFYRPNKQHFHPHTNMAKAALNMITRTSAT
jgi:NAD(P)-dependent dehydrogenase (short-subunit alcohol dehydrogenase family)